MTKMQLNSLLLFFTIGLFHIGSNTEMRPERNSEDLELLVESRMRNMELRLEEMELRNERLDTRNKQLEATIVLIDFLCNKSVFVHCTGIHTYYHWSMSYRELPKTSLDQTKTQCSHHSTMT